MLVLVTSAFAHNVPLVGDHQSAAQLSGFYKAPPTFTLDMSVFCALRNENEFKSRVAEEGDLHSPQYGKSISPEEFTERYQTRRTDYESVRAWLVSSGFTITRAAYNKTLSFISFRGTASLVESVFHTTIVTNGSGKFANTTDPLIPSTFHGIISYVALDNLGETYPGKRRVPHIPIE